MKRVTARKTNGEDVSTISKVLVGLQLFFLIMLFVSGPVIPMTPAAILFILAGLLLGQWAILYMRRSKLRLTAEVAPGATLVTTGPYALIRHPMYTAVLLVGLGLAFIDFSAVRVVSLFLLLVVLICKSAYEESLLTRAFPGYAAYMKKTYRFIPFLF